jgi:type VI secretion system secreted protein Hcp
MASDYLLVIDGIKGESKDSKKPDSIEVDSFSWGVSNQGSFSAGTGGGSGKASLQDLHFTTGVNLSSPLLALACATGQHIKKAELFVRKQGGEQEIYYTLTLNDLLVSSYQSGGHEGAAARPTDQFSLNYAQIQLDYQPQKPDGSLGSKIHFGYDVKANKKI